MDENRSKDNTDDNPAAKKTIEFELTKDSFKEAENQRSSCFSSSFASASKEKYKKIGN